MALPSLLQDPGKRRAQGLALATANLWSGAVTSGPLGAHQRRSLLSEPIWRAFLTTVTSLCTSFGDPALVEDPPEASIL